MKSILFAALASVGVVSMSVAAPTPSYIAAAVADKARPAEDVARDSDRKPAEMLIFAGIKPGDAVVDVMP
ncbi:MAG TPA: hypothetical protein VGG69_09065, partial [Rhizomicrobium sp.]